MSNWQELELDEITDWPLLPQSLVVFLLVIVLLAGGYWAFVKPDKQRLNLSLIHI